ncbi:hypothetical protein GXN76_09605 [Kroppenstedtia pulmonis]|uniref:Uncharacterized protein n=1 Tax=Kroppenstedtia pulmonis TaxID=1380685 RepID=A0A7D3XR06_9BACL|nr:hypothetical protein [Kroppenstedtia pulmonis]QKG84702.1 hypothetical protein GXN76_09605 [Kroppenstedtia pulmonis]
MADVLERHYGIKPILYVTYDIHETYVAGGSKTLTSGSDTLLNLHLWIEIGYFAVQQQETD